MRIFAAKPGRAAVAVVLAAALPRLAVLGYERGAILTSYVEKSDIFARTFLSDGTYGFVPGVPSAYTQPLYGWFLIVLYELDRSWSVVGVAQICVACSTALVVYRIGKLVAGERVGLVAAVLATLNPYLIWHDVHVNREILDQLLAAAMMLSTLLAVRRGGVLAGAALGVAGGLAALGNTRVALLPLVLAILVVIWRRDRRAVVAGCATVLAALVTVTPWVVRNRVQVGCFAITTDAHALWKANNINTYATLARGGWIDDVPPLAGVTRITPEYEYDFWRNDHRIVRVDECRQMRIYKSATIRFWKHHPREKARLIVQATRMLWQPQQTRTEGGPSSAGVLRSWIEAAWTLPVYLLAAIGLFVVSRRFAVLALVFLVYETLEAWVFAGATRYRVSFDFVLALLAAAVLDRLLSRWRYTASTPSAAAASENDSSARRLAAAP